MVVLQTRRDSRNTLISYTIFVFSSDGKYLIDKYKGVLEHLSISTIPGFLYLSIRNVGIRTINKLDDIFINTVCSSYRERYELTYTKDDIVDNYVTGSNIIGNGQYVLTPWSYRSIFGVDNALVSNPYTIIPGGCYYGLFNLNVIITVNYVDVDKEPPVSIISRPYSHPDSVSRYVLASNNGRTYFTTGRIGTNTNPFYDVMIMIPDAEHIVGDIKIYMSYDVST